MPSKWYDTEGFAIAFWLASLPTPRMVITVLKPSFLAIFTPGAMALRSTKELICCVSKSSPSRTVIACDKSCRLSLRFSAVTNTSSKTSVELSAKTPPESVAANRVGSKIREEIILVPYL